MGVNFLSGSPEARITQQHVLPASETSVQEPCFGWSSNFLLLIISFRMASSNTHLAEPFGDPIHNMPVRFARCWEFQCPSPLRSKRDFEASLECVRFGHANLLCSLGKLGQDHGMFWAVVAAGRAGAEAATHLQKWCRLAVVGSVEFGMRLWSLGWDVPGGASTATNTRGHASKKYSRHASRQRGRQQGAGHGGGVGRAGPDLVQNLKLQI